METDKIVKIIRGSVKSKAQAVVAAEAVNYARILCAVALGKVPNLVDNDLYKLEMSYWRMADEFETRCVQPERASQPD